MKKASLILLSLMLTLSLLIMLSCTPNLEKPSPETIQKDLVGHSLTEGIEPGYYDQSWIWTIDNGQISNFIIEDTLVNTDNQFVITAKMLLTNNVSGKAYNATAKIGYTLSNGKKWIVDYVLSEKMSIVKTGKYDNLIIKEEGKCGDGLFGLDIDFLKYTCYNVSNKSDITLEIGYRKFDGNWSKGSTIINPFDSFLIECDGLIIDYVEKP